LFVNIAHIEVVSSSIFDKSPHFIQVLEKYEKMIKLILDYIHNFNNLSRSFQGLGLLGEINIPDKVAVLVGEKKGEILSLPAITGSQSSKSSENDRELYLEIANFDSEKSATSSFNLNYRSEAVRLYAGGLDDKLSKLALIRYNQFLSQKGGKIQKIYSSKAKPFTEKSFELDFSWLCDQISSELSPEQKEELNRKMNLYGKFENGVFYPRTFLNIVKNKYDLVQEIIRHFDYLSFTDKLIKENIINTSRNGKYKHQKLLRIKQYLSQIGFNEIVTRPFVAKDEVLNLDKSIQLLNPNSQLKPYLSDNLILRHLPILSQNINNGVDNIKFFEVNNVFSKEFSDYEKTQVNLLFEANNPYEATTYLNKILIFLNLQNDVKYEFIETKIGKITRYITQEGNFDLIQLSKLMLKNAQIPFTKKVWSLYFDLTNLDNLVIQFYPNFEPQDGVFKASRVINFKFSESQVCFRQKLEEILNSETKWQIKYNFKDFYQNDEDNILSIELTILSHENELSSQNVNDYMKKLTIKINNIL
jgi:phenylalanyl-tRNA synthetase beta subunit